MNFYDFVIALTGGLFVLAVILMSLSLIIAVVCLIGRYKLYKKLGKEGWEAIIPVYSEWTLCELVGLNWWWTLLLAAPLITSFIGADNISNIARIISVFGYAVVGYNYSKKTHRDNDILFIICFALFSYIVLAIDGFSKTNNFDSSVEVSKNGFIN